MEILKNPLIFTENFEPAEITANILSMGETIIWDSEELVARFEDVDTEFISCLSICYKGQGMRLLMGSYSMDLPNSFDEYSEFKIPVTHLPDVEDFDVRLIGSKIPRELKHLKLINKNKE